MCEVRGVEILSLEWLLKIWNQVMNLDIKPIYLYDRVQGFCQLKNQSEACLDQVASESKDLKIKAPSALDITRGVASNTTSTRVWISRQS